MTVHILKAPAGLGKTSLVLEKICAAPQHQRVEIYVPTHALAEELRAKLAEKGEHAIVVRGREQDLNAERRMCRKSKVAGAIARLGYPVFPVICMGPQIPGDQHSAKACEHFSTCEYLKQFESHARIFIYTHAYLPLPRNSKETIRPSLVVIDESFIQSCLSTHAITRGTLDELSQRDPLAGCVLRTLMAAIDRREPLLRVIREASLNREILQEVAAALRPAANGFNPFKSDGELLHHLESAIPRNRIDLLLEILADEVATLRADAHGVSFDYEGQVLRLHYRRAITRFEYAAGAPTILIIDANADAELLRPWFPEARLKEFQVERRAYVVQCCSSRGATISFVPDKNTNAMSKERARRNLQGLQELLAAEVDGGKKVLMVGPQAITGNPQRKIPALLTCPPGAALAHFNGLRGVDAYKDFDTVIIVGRNQPPIGELEDLARALWYDDAVALEFAADWVREARPYRIRDATERIGIEVLVHPDARVQRLHEQVREGESTQAIDRLRLVHAEGAKRVVVISSIPLGLEIDELIDLPTLLYKTRLERAWNRLNGVMPLNPDWLAGRFPDLWKTADAARTDLRAHDKSGGFSNNCSISAKATFNFEYWVHQQRRQSRALSSLPLLQTHVELNRLFDAPVNIREIRSGAPAEKIYGGILKASFPSLSAQFHPVAA